MDNDLLAFAAKLREIGVLEFRGQWNGYELALKLAALPLAPMTAPTAEPSRRLLNRPDATQEGGWGNDTTHQSEEAAFKAELEKYL